MEKGRIIKGLSSFYYVKSYEDNEVYECRARGIFRRDSISPVIGDVVEITIIDSATRKGIIESVEERSTFLFRPPIANVTKALLIFAVKSPDPNLSLIDRFIVFAERERLDITICFNKTDLDEDKKYLDYVKIYERAGYKVIAASVKEDLDIELIRQELRNNITVIAGPSGVGKSSLLNAVNPKLNLKTSQISEKLQRGRHTTRYAQLIELEDDSLVADTPGFSALNLDLIEEIELKEYFVEFHEYDHDCKFGFKCIHENEPGCRVKEAVKNNEIPKERYESYLQLLKEIKSDKKRRN